MAALGVPPLAGESEATGGSVEVIGSKGIGLKGHHSNASSARLNVRASARQVAIRSRFRIVPPDSLVTSVPSTTSVLTDSTGEDVAADEPTT